VLALTMATEQTGPAPEDEDVQAAAEHADRAVQERREMARAASRAEAADDEAETSELDQASSEHGHAAHEQEGEAERSARQADGS
jgi:hypothetical protein